MRLRLIAGLLALCLPAWGEIEKRVWFILDNTRSMDDNDTRALAKLSAHMLYSLLDPNAGMDSFHLLTLDRRQTSPRNADELGQYLSQIENNVQHTFYLPAVRDAVEGLDAEKRISPGNKFRKTIVFVTDGGPDDKGTDIEAANSLASSLAAHDIHLYFVLFGPAATAARAKVARMFPPTSNVEILDVPDGSRLLYNVADIFGRAFGAMVDTPRTGRASVDLSHKLISKAAVIAFQNRPDIPLLELNLPDGRRESPTQSRTEKGSSYSLKWLKAPEHVKYAVRTGDDVSTMLLVVEPYRLEPCDASGRPLPPRRDVPPVMATENSRFYFLARDKPEKVDVTVQARSLGEHAAQLQESVCQKRRSEIPAGWLFQVECHFPALGTDPYPAVLDVTPSQNGIENSDAGGHAEVQVYPYSKIAVDPPLESLSSTSTVHQLRRDEEGCAKFHFRRDTGEIPRNTLLALLDDSVRSQASYRQGSATLDGEPLEFEGGEGEWAHGRAIEKSSFFDTEHTFCAIAGLAASRDTNSNIMLPVHFYFAGYPYNELHVIDDFQAEAKVQPPSWWDLWGNGLWLGLGVLLCAILGVGLMRWNFMPARLVCVTWVEPGGGEDRIQLNPNPLVPFVPDKRTVLLERGSSNAGWIRPTSPDLFEFIPAPGVTLSARTGVSGIYTLRVHENYDLVSTRGRYVMRIEYQ